MRQRLATLILLTAPVWGCSLVYNPSNLPPGAGEAGPPDAPDPDAEIILDANPDAIALESVEPSILLEGRGVGGSYATILVVHGTHLVKNATTVTISAHGQTTPYPGITVDNTKLDVSANGRDLAVPVAFAIDTINGATTPRVRLDVTVTQMGGSQLVSATLSGKEPADAPVLELEYLDELTNASPLLTPMPGFITAGNYTFSKVDVTGGLSPRPNATVPLRIAATSSISITGVTSVLATLGTPGAGGSLGGAGGAGVLAGTANPGMPGAGLGGGKSSGGGGGFGSVGAGGTAGGAVSGDATLRDLVATGITSNRSSGGGGGVGAVVIGSAPDGGDGGAGGGVIELSAGGNLLIGDLTAIGGNGSAGASNGGGGGGGSGGTVLIRARGTLTMTSVLATGGLAGGSGDVASHAGGDGRVRIDAPTAEIAPNSSPAAYRGPMLAPNSTLIVRTPTPTFVVVGAKMKLFSWFFSNKDDAQVGTPQLLNDNGSGMLRIPADKPLGRGINKFCLLVDGAASDSLPEAMNCFDVVYLYTP